MTNFKKEEIGKISEVGQNYENGKAFLHDLLGLTSCEISVSAMPAGVKLPLITNTNRMKKFIFS